MATGLERPWEHVMHVDSSFVMLLARTNSQAPLAPFELRCLAAGSTGQFVRLPNLDLLLHFAREADQSRGQSARENDLARLLATRYRELGPTCLQHVAGPFALVAWDAAARTLTLARDMAGRNCLYYLARDGEIFVSNSLPRLLASASVPLRISPHALDLYWALGFVPAPHCIAEQVGKVPAGTAVVIGDGTTRQAPFMPQPLAPMECNRDAVELEDELERHLLNSLQSITSRARRVCLLLSGGVDSSLLGALLKRLGGIDVSTASVVSGIDDAGDRSQQVAVQLGLPHLAIDVPAFSFDRLSELLAYGDEPCSDTMTFPLAQLLERAADVADLCLSGIGADSLFLGLNSHLALEHWDLRQELSRESRRQLGPRVGASVAHDLELLRAAPDITVGWARLFTSLSDEERTALVGTSASTYDGASAVPKFVRGWLGPHPATADRLSRFDAEVPMADSTLQLVRQMAARACITHEAPFLAADVYAFARQIPRRRLIQGAEGKAPVRRLLERSMPSALWRLPKVGFRLPLVKILEDHRTALLEILRSVGSDDVSPTTVDAWTSEFYASSSPRSFVAARRLWRVLTWKLWRSAHGG